MESPSIFTLRLALVEAHAQQHYAFAPGQFNMLYLFGAGEVPISISSDPLDPHTIDHTVRAVGRVTNALATLRAGDEIGLRGPFGRGWPLDDAQGKDVLVLTGGLGCAPVVSVVRYVLRRRRDFGRLIIMQGVKHSNDLIWRTQYQQWAAQPDVQVLLAADVSSDPTWPWYVGRVTALLDQARFDPANTVVMMCGPEAMMRGSAKDLVARGIAAGDIWLSMERNMQCATAHCGHCQLGDRFVCRDGPVFRYADIAPLLGRPGV